MIAGELLIILCLPFLLRKQALHCLKKTSDFQCFGLRLYKIISMWFLKDLGLYPSRRVFNPGKEGGEKKAWKVL